MASLIQVRINKGDFPNLGFRLQGGKDFGTPLVIQKVNVGSPAERAGLVAGDSVIKINNTDVFNLRHKDAQDVVLRAGPSFEMTIQRGGSTWKPSVVPTGPLSTPSPHINSATTVTRTSLASNKSENIGAIGTGHNLSAKPFSPQVNGAVNGGPRLVNTQYNSPVKLYSEESIAETLSAQTEVLSTGALGVNFKKNEKNYDASNSEVLRALKEAENDTNYNDQEPDSGVVTTPNSGIAGLRHVQAPENKPQPPQPQLPPGQNICADCERLIVGVFVRIKDKNLHVECFKCSTCGSSLKNVGYYNINNKLYCDIHAKSAALKNQSNPNLVPVTVPPGGKAPVHAISSALSSHSYPTSSPLSPKLNTAGNQFQAEDTKESVDVSSELPLLAKSNVGDSNISNNNILSNSTPVSFNKYLTYKTNVTGPKPFSSVTAPLSPSNTLPRAAPLSPVAPAPAPSFNSHSYTPSAYSPSSVQVTENIVWPPPQEEPEVPTACPLFYPPPSQIEQKIIKKRKEKELEADEYCSEIEEINTMAQYSQGLYSQFSSRRKSTEECREALTETLDTQLLVENIVKRNTPPSLTQDVAINIPNKPPSPQKLEDNTESCPKSEFCCQKEDSCDLKRPTEFSPNTFERITPSIDNAVPLKWESPLTQAIRTTSPDKDTFASIPTKYSSSALVSALSVAPSEPFIPSGTHKEAVPLPEETEPYFPPERPVLPPEQYGCIDGDSSAPPIRKKFKNPNDKLLEDLPKPQQKLSMLAALTTAPERPYSPFTESNPAQNTNKVQETPRSKADVNRPLKPDVLPPSFEMQKKEPKPPSYYPPSVLYEKTKAEESEEHREESNTKKTTTIQRETVQNPELIQIVLDENQKSGHNIAPIFHGFSCSFQNKGDISQFSVDVRTTPPILSPPPTEPVIKTIETRPGFVQRETVTEEKTEKQQTVKKFEQVQKQQKIVQRIEDSVAKQAEEAVPVKAAPQVALKKPKQLPQYQVELSAEAESELILLEKKRQAELRLQEQMREETKKSTEATMQDSTKVLSSQKPIIKVETENDKVKVNPPIDSFSSRPGATTPSRIGNKSPLLPYYQANLVPQPMSARHSNIFDPRSPAVSRSPSPLPGGIDRGTSPTRGRAISPAPGPPENPLKSSKPLPNPETIRIDQARDSLTQYLPEYQFKRDMIEELQGIHASQQSEPNPQMYTSSVQTQSFPISQQQVTSCQHVQNFALEKTDRLEAQRLEKSVSKFGDTVMSTSVDEQLRQAHLEQLRKSQSESVERSADGLTQVQRKKVVTEEYERSQKEVNIQIEKHLSTTDSKKYPFTSVNVPALEPSNAKRHITDPQRTVPSQKSQFAATAQNIISTPAQTLASNAASSATKHVYAPSTIAPLKHVTPPSTSKKPNVPSVSQPDTGAGSGKQAAGVKVAPRRGRGVLNPAAIGGARIPLCGSCNMQVRGPFITALGKIWCPNHFICATPSCRRPLQDIGFVEERGQLYCEYCFEQYLAPPCAKCAGKIKGDCLKAIGKNFHPECFNCTYCGKLFGNSPFFLEDGSPYCEADWNELFTTKCYACAFPIEAGDRWVEALNNNYHSQCFNCTMCKKNLEGQSFFAKGGRPFCKNHAR
ncbi:PDZ and LIM domain protein Zasp isoform X2 [Diorhabda sublineata]|uniref:PDZ and LIM domain protein Zasp isoform X2 n=1 Tax=Diorhabda sublineata TaxID=1163346 RepID=UPI0024E0F8A2|nr:PDZ and LIM domain protein Zasp isoform X2 [Diorhabda sublineata]